MTGKLFDLLSRYKRDEHGAMAVEFGLTAIFFLILMVGVMESGRVAWTLNGVRFAVEETARYAALNSDSGTEEFTTYAEEKLSDFFIPTAGLTLDSTALTSNGVNFIEIEGTYTHTTMLSDFLPGGYGTFDFNATSRQPVIE